MKYRFVLYGVILVLMMRFRRKDCWAGNLPYLINYPKGSGEDKRRRGKRVKERVGNGWRHNGEKICY